MISFCMYHYCLLVATRIYQLEQFLFHIKYLINVLIVTINIICYDKYSFVYLKYTIPFFF